MHAPDFRAVLAEWRERGADRLDPVRFRLIEALERRAASRKGGTRGILERRLSELIATYGDHLRRAATQPVANSAAPRQQLGRGALGRLVDEMTADQPQPARAKSSATGTLHARMNSNAASEAPGPEHEVLAYFREVWSKVSAEKTLRESHGQVPANAGPLNSQSLVHRSLALMHEVSPAYLRQFLSYVDALSLLEAMTGHGSIPVKDGPRANSARRSGKTSG
jgi:hypothetical protein